MLITVNKEQLLAMMADDATIEVLADQGDGRDILLLTKAEIENGVSDDEHDHVLNVYLENK